MTVRVLAKAHDPYGRRQFACVCRADAEPPAPPPGMVRVVAPYPILIGAGGCGQARAWRWVDEESV